MRNRLREFLIAASRQSRSEMGNCMKQKSKISGNVPARWHAFYACGLCLLVSVLIVTGVFGAVSLSGCSMIKKDSSKVMGLEYTVVKDEEIPVELKKLIEAKKANTLRMTYATKDATYIVAGYGTQPTSGYSIRVNDLYLGTNAVYADVDLLGPEAGEDITELPTTPYIVLKIQKREESVVFCM